MLLNSDLWSNDIWTTAGLASSPSRAWGVRADSKACVRGMAELCSTAQAGGSSMCPSSFGSNFSLWPLTSVIFLPPYFLYCLCQCLPMRYKLMTCCCWHTNSILSSRIFNHRGAEEAGHAERQQATPHWEAKGWVTPEHIHGGGVVPHLLCRNSFNEVALTNSWGGQMVSSDVTSRSAVPVRFRQLESGSYSEQQESCFAPNHWALCQKPQAGSFHSKAGSQPHPRSQALQGVRHSLCKKTRLSSVVIPVMQRGS